MNERIKELMDQAVTFRLDPDSNAYEAQVCPEELEYFAEIILEDIMRALKDVRVGNRCTFTTYDKATVDCAKGEIIKMIETTYNVKEPLHANT